MNGQLNRLLLRAISVDGQTDRQTDILTESIVNTTATSSMHVSRLSMPGTMFHAADLR